MIMAKGTDTPGVFANYAMITPISKESTECWTC
jgi:hypothetical protein